MKAHPLPNTDELHEVRCPSCGFLLMKMSKLSGDFQLQVKCKNCRQIIRIEYREKKLIRENEEAFI